MRKIPTIFERDWDGDRSRVLDKPHADCGWVFAGEGVPTQKLDGTCCIVSGGKLFKRREVKPGQSVPSGFELVEPDNKTGKQVGWVPVGDGPEDQYHRAAFRDDLADGTYELVGPKVQSNLEREWHDGSPRLIHHLASLLSLNEPFDRTFDGIKAFLEGKNMEGIVFHHPDGRMAKIKLKDFGLKRP